MDEGHDARLFRTLNAKRTPQGNALGLRVERGALSSRNKWDFEGHKSPVGTLCGHATKPGRGDAAARMSGTVFCRLCSVFGLSLVPEVVQPGASAVVVRPAVTDRGTPSFPLFIK